MRFYFIKNGAEKIAFFIQLDRIVVNYDNRKFDRKFILRTKNFNILIDDVYIISALYIFTDIK